MKKLLSLPPNLVEFFYDIEKADRDEWFCTSDPLSLIHIWEQDAMKLGWIAHQDKPVTREMTAFLHHMTEALNDALSPSEEMRQ